MCIIVVNVLRLVKGASNSFQQMIPCFFTFQNLIINHNYDARCRHRFSSHNDIFSRLWPPPQVMRLTAVRSSQEQTGRCRDDRSSVIFCWSFVSTSSWMTFWKLVLSFQYRYEGISYSSCWLLWAHIETFTFWCMCFNWFSGQIRWHTGELRPLKCGTQAC